MRLRKNAKVELISKVPLFASCSKKELAQIAMLADEVDLREGKVLIREGRLGEEFFVLVDGEVDVEKDGRKLRMLGPGDFFGEIALVSKSRRTATVTATSPVRVLVMTRQSFRALLDRSPQIQAKVLQALAERLAPQMV